MFKRVFFKLRQCLYSVVIVPKQRSPDTRAPCHSARKRKWNENYVTHKLTFDSLDICFEKILGLNQNLVLERKEMESSIQPLKPPEIVRGMVKLDKTKFDDVLKVPAITVPVKDLQRISRKLKNYRLKLKGVSTVVELDKDDPNFNSHKKFLLDAEKIPSVADLQEELQKLYEDENKCHSDIELFDLKLSYDNWNFSDVMQAILPDNIGVAGFAEVGHIAHFNLREQTLPFKHIIGEVLLEKSKTLKTVVNKLNTIDNTYRTFEMELLAGEDNFVTQTKENGCVFELDFSKVYWNSRLSTEHHVMTKNLERTHVVFDVFAGIGPFAIPAVKKKALVFANDLNPFSYENLVKNVKLNDCNSDLITCSNLDGREFIHSVVKEKLTGIYSKQKTCEGIDTENLTGISILMNLPALAYTFLDAFRGLLSEVEDFDPDIVLPIVHCYCFTNLQEAVDKWNGDMNVELKHRVIDIVGGLREEDLNLRYVRDVAPQKIMMCVSFTLTREILSGVLMPKRELLDIEVKDEPPAKCQKIEASPM